MSEIRTGSCLCGGVRFELHGEIRNIIHCHCTQCRKTSGHHWAATRARDEQVKVLSDETLTWFRSSKTAKRGFCNRCGSSVFYRRDTDDGPAIGAGCLDDESNLISIKHIYTSDKGDYYDISDGLPQS